MNALTPDIQNELLKAARHTPVRLLFAGDNARGKTQAAELLAVHYDLYLFRVDLRRLLAADPARAVDHLERLFARAAEAGDMLLFDEGEALFAGLPGLDPDALPFFLQQLRRYKGVIIVSISGATAPDPNVLERFGAVIRFPATAEV